MNFLSEVQFSKRPFCFIPHLSNLNKFHAMISLSLALYHDISSMPFSKSVKYLVKLLQSQFSC